MILKRLLVNKEIMNDLHENNTQEEIKNLHENTEKEVDYDTIPNLRSEIEEFEGSNTETMMKYCWYWLLKAVENGSVDAQFILAQGYYFLAEETNDMEGLTKALNLFRKAADRGHVKSLLYLAQCYQEGTGVPENETFAKCFYRKAAEQGCNSSDFVLEAICFRLLYG